MFYYNRDFILLLRARSVVASSAPALAPCKDDDDDDGSIVLGRRWIDDDENEAPLRTAMRSNYFGWAGLAGCMAHDRISGIESKSK